MTCFQSISEAVVERSGVGRTASDIFRYHFGPMSVDERREAPRHPRRIQVRFWADGGSHGTSGMTSNLSLRGAFISAPKVHPRGTRVRIELQRKDGPVVIEGEVAHAHRVPVELRALGTSGMGIRFLPPEDLVAPMLPAEMVEEPDDALEPNPEESEADGAPAVFTVSFALASEFLQCYHRDLVNGGIFVRTERPRPIRSLIELEFDVPGREEPLSVRGRVVQVIEPRSGEHPPHGGMGVELLGLDDLLADLEPILERLGG